MFVLGKPFQPTLMFLGKATSLPLSGTSWRCFTREGSGLTRKHKTRLERLARDKHLSLLQKIVNYLWKSYITLVPGQFILLLSFCDFEWLKLHLHARFSIAFLPCVFEVLLACIGRSKCTGLPLERFRLQKCFSKSGVLMDLTFSSCL